MITTDNGSKYKKYNFPQANPEIIEWMRHDYEVLGLGSRQLARKYPFARSTIDRLITKGEWVYFAGPRPDDGVLEARAAATKILVEGLGSRLGLKPRVRRKGPARPPQDRPEPPALARAAPEGGAGPLEEVSHGSRATADVLPFPGAPFPPVPKRAVAVQLMPGLTREEQVQGRMALATIRSMMTLDQVRRLDHLSELLRRYGHLLDVYLDPARFVPRDEDLSEEQHIEKIDLTQKLALSRLLPTQKDTLEGAIGTLTKAMHTVILLERSVAGLQNVKAASGGSPDIEREGDESGVNPGEMPTGELRQVVQAMELLRRRQNQRVESPKPPPPDPIDDLMDPPMGEGPPEPEVSR